ncbi:serum response factor-binding protein 1 [Hetaerina americana]|uniref:serum response factor-binding protein 1 n=1 Tax=Hetaerina americana TaxID=62018 RepID=UPI003A7F4F38
MIDKRTLNNEIVAMRKVVKQAKVHIIGRLSREIKNLRNKEGPEELKAKCNRKADRKRDEIYAVKKLAVDDVSKFALKNREDAVKKIGDAGVNSELRAYFRFAASKVLSARVTAFREQYPDWKDYIHDLLDELGARRKNLKPQVRLTKEMGPAQNTPLTKKNPEIKQDEKPSVPIQKSKDATVEGAAKKINEKSVSSKASPALVNKSKFLSQWSVEEIEPAVDQVSHVEIHLKDRLKNVKGASQSAPATPSAHKLDNQLRWSSTKKSSGIAEVKRFHELCETQESPSIETKKPPVMDEGNSEDDDDVTADGQVVDPFFVKSDGKTEYVTKMVVDEGIDEGEKDSPLPFAGREKQSGGAQQWSEGGWGAREGSRGGRGE